jgi:hypothetical protein
VKKKYKMLAHSPEGLGAEAAGVGEGVGIVLGLDVIESVVLTEK